MFTPYYQAGELAGRQAAQVRPEAETVGRGVAAVAGDQPRARGAVEVGVPGPPQVAGRLGVQPAHQRPDVAGSAVVLADLAGDDRHLRDHRGHLVLPAGPVRARVEVVGVPGRGQAVVGVGRLVGQPLPQVVGVLLAAEHEYVGGAGGPDRVDHALHPCHLVGDACAGATVQPAVPAAGRAAGGTGRVRLVEQVEDDRV